jgi:hypothetical protein
MYKNATKCNETMGKWCKTKHGASKIIDTFETYHYSSFSQIAVRKEDQVKTTFLVLMELMLIDVCRLVYAMLLLLFKDVCLLFFMVFVRKL